MDFMQSQTVLNLARSFAGESQARNRYLIYALQAEKEGQEYLASIFRETAHNEFVHAQEFLEQLEKYGAQPIENLTFEAGYPYAIGTTLENLKYAANGEQDEHQNAYPGFAKIAQEEGFESIARLWTLIASVEGNHSRVFREAAAQLENGSLYQKQTPILWRCKNCGYLVIGKEPYEKCPICSKPQGWAEGDIPNKIKE